MVLVGKPEEKRQLGLPKHRWSDNIKMNLKERGCEVMDWIYLAQGKDNRHWTLVNVPLNPLHSVKCEEFLDKQRNYEVLKKDLLNGASQWG
jgi:hypothetical protein